MRFICCSRVEACCLSASFFGIKSITLTSRAVATLRAARLDESLTGNPTFGVVTAGTEDASTGAFVGAIGDSVS